VALVFPMAGQRPALRNIGGDEPPGLPELDAGECRERLAFDRAEQIARLESQAKAWGGPSYARLMRHVPAPFSAEQMSDVAAYHAGLPMLGRAGRR
jgi:hypothetical protein